MVLIIQSIGHYQTGLGGLWGSLKLLDGWGLALLPSVQEVHDCLPVS